MRPLSGSIGTTEGYSRRSTLGTILRWREFREKKVTSASEKRLGSQSTRGITTRIALLYSCPMMYDLSIESHFLLSRSIGASILIDDNTGYAVECAEAGIDVLLYDWNMKYPWSKLPPA